MLQLQPIEDQLRLCQEIMYLNSHVHFTSMAKNCTEVNELLLNYSQRNQCQITRMDNCSFKMVIFFTISLTFSFTLTMAHIFSRSRRRLKQNPFLSIHDLYQQLSGWEGSPSNGFQR